MSITCAFENCPKPRRAKGLCTAHYQQARAGKDLAQLGTRPSALDRDSFGRKHCTKCNAWHPIDQFQKDTSRKDGLNPLCKMCESLRMRAKRGREVRTFRMPRAGVPCSFEGCNSERKVSDLCISHADQVGRGEPLTALNQKGDASARDEFGNKLCVSCDEWLPESHFGVRRENGGSLSSWCSCCFNRSYRLRRFNITEQQHDEMLSEQGGTCAICRKENTGERQLCVDHDHECCPESSVSCGVCVRGLLCHRCNLLLGYALDDPETLRNAADYIAASRMG